MLRWIEIHVKSYGDITPPFFMGSMLRGALGVGLKRVVCINPKYECSGCFAAARCPYFDWYEAPNVTHPFRLGIALAQKRLDCSVLVFEEATASLAYLISALHKTYEEVGFGREHRKERIASISANGIVVYENGRFGTLEALAPRHLEIDRFCQNLTIEFTMPIRIKHNNALSGETLTLPMLISTIHNRYLQLKNEEPRKLGYIIGGTIVKSDLKFVETERYSNRQRTKMNMGGLKGTLHIRGLDKQSYVYLKIGEIIGAGKQTAFGLGSYIIKEEH